jgi:hypothetical protein
MNTSTERIKVISPKRLAGLLAVMACIVGTSAVAASSASAACYKVASAKTGKYSNAGCTEEKVGATEKEYVKATLVGRVVEGVWCAKVEPAGTGVYEDNKCTKVGGGKEYIKVLIPEFTPETSQKFTDKSGTSELRSAKHETITCASDITSGEIAGPKTVANVKDTYFKCTQGASKIKCRSIPNPEKKSEGTEGKEEEIITNTVEGELGTVSGGTGVGEDLKPVTGDTRFVTIKCGTLNVSVTGSVIGEVTPLNKLQTTGDVVFAANSGNTNQAFTEITLSGGPTTDHLTAFTENAWLVSTDEITFEKAVEVSA